MALVTICTPRQSIGLAVRGAGERPRRRLRSTLSPIAYDTNPEFNYRSFRTTGMRRWEYKPGSALFLWQRRREDVLDAGAFQFGRDFRGAFSSPSSNVFLVKWSYWQRQRPPRFYSIS